MRAMPCPMAAYCVLNKAQNIRIDDYYARMNLEAQVGNYILLTVADSGTGIKPQVLERIFEPFLLPKS